MLNYIGDIDSNLRDSLILSILSYWISNDVFSTAELKELLRISLNEKHVLNGFDMMADVLDEFARCDELKYFDLIKILDAIYNKVNVNYYGYIHFEDKGMITVIEAILERNIIPIPEIINWINRFKSINKINNYPEALVIDFNRTLFLKSLFFRLSDNNNYTGLTKLISNILKEISNSRY